MVVAWTVGYMAFFEMVTYVDVGNGQPGTGWIMLDAYGWPWVYMAEYDWTPESQKSLQEDGYLVYFFNWPEFWSDLAVVLLTILGASAAFHHVAAVGVRRFRFSLRTMMAMFVAVAVMLSLPDAGDILWPNWFVQGVVYIGLVAASLGFMLLASRLFSTWMDKRSAI